MQNVSRFARVVFRTRVAWLLAGAVGALACGGALFAQNDVATQRAAILNHLNAMISWHRDATASVAPGELPSDAVFQQNVRTLGDQAIQLAFQSARANAALLQQEAAPSATPANPSQQNYAQMKQRVSQRISNTQKQVDALGSQIARTAGAKRQPLVDQRDALNEQITLDKAILEDIDKMSQFVELNAGGSKGLEGSIKELEGSVPEVLNQPGKPGAANQTSTQPASPTISRSPGIIGQLVTLYDLVQSMRAVGRLESELQTVTDAANAVREPLRSSIRSIIAQAQEAAQPQQTGQPQASGQPPQPAQAATPSGPQVTESYSQLTRQFNQLSNAILPLSQEIIVLQQIQSNLQEWRNSIGSESKRDVFALLVRVIGIAIALGLVWLLSEIWRKLTFRYVHDPRRRRQFLVLRRFVAGFLFVVVVLVGFVSEFGSLATYAGFVTAGVAVALQTLLLSVAAYFFVVGRYGIRVGDRISVAGVTGDVVDVGLVRLYIMELAGTGVDLYPTGRIAVFSNSVLFQPATPLFKQVPGTEYAWHQVTLPIAPGGDHKLVQDKTLAAVNREYEKYRGIMENQQGAIGERNEIILQAPKPESKFQLNGNGMAFFVRYPVPLSSASEIDDRVARALIDEMLSDPALKSAVSGMPKIEAAVKA